MKKKLLTSTAVAGLGLFNTATKIFSQDFSVGEVTARTYQPGQIITTGVTWAGAGSGIAALIFLIFSGLKYITAGGDPAKVEAAQKQIISAIVGLAIVVLSYTLIRFVFYLLGAEFGLEGLQPLEST